MYCTLVFRTSCVPDYIAVPLKCTTAVFFRVFPFICIHLLERDITSLPIPFPPFAQSVLPGCIEFPPKYTAPGTLVLSAVQAQHNPDWYKIISFVTVIISKIIICLFAGPKNKELEHI